LPDTPARIGRNELVFREVNERIHALGERFALEHGEIMDFVCECSRPDCKQTVWLTLDEYRGVRGVERYFVVVPTHVDLESDRVIDENDRFVVVEKVSRAGGVAEDAA
jgi:hypothetical protein